MNIIDHESGSIRIAELDSDNVLINSASDATEVVGNIYYQGYDKVIIKEKNLSEEFFDLKNKMAGEILQKFSNYRIGLAIVGNFEKYNSKSIKDFIRESNRSGQINFTETLDEAISKLTR